MLAPELLPRVICTLKILSQFTENVHPSIRTETVTQAKHFIFDSVEALAKFGKFGTDAWERIVCVMTTGQAWQFRSYKWNEPRQLFHNGEFLIILSL